MKRLSFLWLWLAGAALAGPPADPPPRPTVLFFGDSLTAGYGVGEADGFPARVQGLADSAGCAVRVVNAGLPGETTAGGLRRVDWILRQPVDVFVLELGGNDGLRGVPLAETERNLQGIIDRVRQKAPAARLVIAGVRLPPNLGPDYTDGFGAIFPRLAEANGAALIPRLLEGVAGDRELMRADGIHPNVEGHRRVARTVWRTLAPLLCGADGPGPEIGTDDDVGSAGAPQDLEGRYAGDAAAAGEADADGQDRDRQ